jgi:hypothetical protein
MPRTMQAAAPFRIVATMFMIALRDLLAGVAGDLWDHAVVLMYPTCHEIRRTRRLVLIRSEHMRRAIYVPTRQEVLIFGLMFSLGANLVTVLTLAVRA